MARRRESFRRLFTLMGGKSSQNGVFLRFFSDFFRIAYFLRSISNGTEVKTAGGEHVGHCKSPNYDQGGPEQPRREARTVEEHQSSGDQGSASHGIEPREDRRP